jgi:hypothetical protein
LCPLVEVVVVTKSEERVSLGEYLHVIIVMGVFSAFFKGLYQATKTGLLIASLYSGVGLLYAQ